MVAALLTTVLFSISAVCAQRTSRVLGGVEANFWRIILATALLGLWAHTLGQGFGGQSFPYFLLSGFIGFGIGDVALYQALPRIGSRLSTLLVHCLAAPVAAVTEWLWLGTTMSSTQIGAAVVVLAGVAVAIAPGRHLNISRRTFWIGVTAAVIASMGQCFGAVFSRVAYNAAHRAGDSIDGFTAAYQRILAGLAVATFVFIFVKWRRSQAQEQEATATSAGRPRLWPWVAANAVAGPAIGVGCFQWALKDLGTGVVLPIVALTPLVIIPFSRYVEGERPRKRSIFGGVLAVAGVFVLLGGIDAIVALRKG
jgi:drug/metabolite transporter (DMT)-like permease